MIKLKIVVLVLLVAFFSFSCKKKNNDPAPVPNTNPIVASEAYSNHQADYYYLDYGGTVTKDSMVVVSYYQSPPTSSVMPVFVSAGNVYFNGSPLTYSTNQYQNSGPVSINGAITWSVSGSGTITAFAHTYTASHPSYTGGNLLPDTCQKSAGIAITVSGVSNAASVSVSLFQGTNKLSQQIFTINGTAFFSATDLSSFATAQPITININCGNYKTETLGGVLHGFSNNVFYNKIAYLK